MEHLAIEEQDGVEGLILGGVGDDFLHSQVGQECFYFGGAPFGRVAHVVEKDLVFASEGMPPAPADVGLLPSTSSGQCDADGVALALSCDSMGDGWRCGLVAASSGAVPP